MAAQLLSITLGFDKCYLIVSNYIYNPIAQSDFNRFEKKKKKVTAKYFTYCKCQCLW